MWGLFRWAHKGCLGRKLRGELWTGLFPLVSSNVGLVRSVTLGGVTLWEHCIVQTGLLQGMFESMKLLPRLSGGVF